MINAAALVPLARKAPVFIILYFLIVFSYSVVLGADRTLFSSSVPSPFCVLFFLRRHSRYWLWLSRVNSTGHSSRSPNRIDFYLGRREEAGQSNNQLDHLAILAIAACACSLINLQASCEHSVCRLKTKQNRIKSARCCIDCSSRTALSMSDCTACILQRCAAL